MTQDGPKIPNGKTPPGGQEFLPPVEFSSIVLLLYFPALVQLGLVDDPATGGRQTNLELAKRNIDLLDLLRDRTKGNLEPEEQTFIDGALDQLKLAYLEKADILKM
ncbi:MAG TPA: DUF1844 domain-containing protein [Candidatus Aminicenantes bacterium]|nr:DUF1844 domain-containing protein [Candidatus Aminicenantes bacterium]HDT13025.1 DUF1844 domain-containing protein [Candidatus Aminicenantes bacterium]